MDPRGGQHRSKPPSDKTILHLQLQIQLPVQQIELELEVRSWNYIVCGMFAYVPQLICAGFNSLTKLILPNRSNVVQPNAVQCNACSLSHNKRYFDLVLPRLFYLVCCTSSAVPKSTVFAENHWNQRHTEYPNIDR